MSPSPTVVLVTDAQGSPSAFTAPDTGPSIPPSASVTTSIVTTKPKSDQPPTVILVTVPTSPKPSSLAPFLSTSSLQTSPSPSTHSGSSHQYVTQLISHDLTVLKIKHSFQCQYRCCDRRCLRGVHHPHHYHLGHLLPQETEPKHQSLWSDNTIRFLKST